MKRLGYILIPVLAVLLMSHNTFAVGRKYTPYTCYDIVGQGVTCGNYAVTTGNTIQVISISKSNNTDLNSTSGEYFLWALNVRSYGSANTQLGINLANGYPEMAKIENIYQDCNTTNGYTSCNILVTGILYSNNFNLQLAGQVTGFGASYTIDSLYFSSNWDFDLANYNNIAAILTYLRNNPTPSAQDIASAIENTAEQNTQNAANDSQTAGSSSSQDATTATSSLISAIGGFVGAVTTASPTNCVVNFTTNQLTIGNMDLCANPVPAYVQIIGSIILICAAIPLAIVLFNRFIGLFRSFQG